MAKKDFDAIRKQKQETMSSVSEANPKREPAQGRVSVMTDDERKIADKINQIGMRTGEKPTLIPLNQLTDAPKDWNVFPRLSDEKHMEMVFSILDWGLFSPIIVWEIKHLQEYMILAGHNRVDAYRNISKVYSGFNHERELKLLGDDATETERQNLLNFEPANYNSIPAFVFKKNDIDEIQAQEIILDTNYIQRGRDPRTEPLVIAMRMKLKKSQKDVRGKKIHAVAKELGVSPTKVYENDVFATQLIPELQSLYFDKKATLRSLIRLKDWSPETQKWFFDSYEDRLTTKVLNSFSKNKNYSKAEIEEIIDSLLDEPNYVTVNFKIEEELAEELREYVSKWIINKRHYAKKKGLNENPPILATIKTVPNSESEKSFPKKS